jgi:hypothetical protein
MKGRNAIEFLKTYRWILLAAAIVGGAIFVNIDAPQSSTTEPEPRQGLPSNVDVFEYEGATCFMSHNINGEGISCVPTAEIQEVN